MCEKGFDVNSPYITAWLLENYEAVQGIAVPRSNLYANYVQYCTKNKLNIITPALLGKVIRTVFCGIRTRRLGARGNSKYQYYGIRQKKTPTLKISFTKTKSGCYVQKAGRASDNNCEPNETRTRKLNEYLGKGDGIIADLPEMIFVAPLPEGCYLKDLAIFRNQYQNHCETLLNAILRLEFENVKTLWKEFWRSNISDGCENYLSSSKLLTLCSINQLQSFIRLVDERFYRSLIQVLLPNVLRPIPDELVNAIQNFANNLESWIQYAMEGWPQKILDVKLVTISKFKNSLIRFLALNNFAQGARAVLNNKYRVTQMLQDLREVDLDNIKNQLSWVCEYDYNFVLNIVNNFEFQLRQLNSLEQWAARIKHNVIIALKQFQGKPNYSNKTKQFFLISSLYRLEII